MGVRVFLVLRNGCDGIATDKERDEDMDTIQIHQMINFPASAGKEPIPVDVDGYAVISNDSLHDALCGIRDSMTQQGQTLEALTTKVNEISEYGVGYHDSIGIIVIPIIIALFAFTMPLLFQVITHINSKYSSQSISEMFENTRSYKLFWIISKVSIGYLLLVGLFSLIFKGTVYERLMIVLNYIGLFVALAYVLSTLKFIKTCISFNSPQKLLAIIGRQYKDELQNDNLKLVFNKLDYIRIKTQFWKSKGWKSFKTFVYRGRRWVAHYKTNNDYGNRIADLCKYAMSKRDNSLFIDVIIEVEKITRREKIDRMIAPEFSANEFGQPLYLTFTNAFYKEILEFYNHCDEYSDFEDRLIRSWLRSFNHNKFPNEQGIVEIVRTIVNAVEAGRIGMYEKYIRHSAFDYLFIQELQTSAFIQGADGNDQIRFDDERRAAWKRICDLHLLMNAYLLSQGHYEIVKPLLSVNSYFQGHLYAMGPHEYLACYANCKKAVHEGGYWHWSNKDMFGKEAVDEDMLEMYTVTMMLIAPAMPNTVRAIASDDSIKQMKESKATLLACANKFHLNHELHQRYPNINVSQFENLYDKCIRAFEDGTILEKKAGQYEEQPGFWTSLIGSVESFFCSKWTGKEQIKRRNLYSTSLPKERKMLFADDVMNVFRNTGWMPRGLIENQDKGSLDKITMQPLSMLMNKRYMYYYDHDNLFHLQRHFEILFDSRVTYMVYTALSQMDIIHKNVCVGDFEVFFRSYTEGHNSDYMIVDTDCELSANLEIETENIVGNWKYKEADYSRKCIDANGHLKDTPLMGLFNNSLLIIKKEDFPSLVKINENDKPQIDLEDCSDSTRGLAAIKVTIASNMELRYYKSSKVAWINLTR